jgi:3,4-dihydroxy 2-butanone 4-phosphate synthase/GTP cyclohydrolase II
MHFNTIEEAITDLEQGRMIIVVDDENRENEGDFVMSAEMITPEAVNFMAMHGRGLICTPLTKEIANKLEIPPMIQKSTDSLETAFTITVDAKDGITTGISAADRSRTIELLSCPNTLASDFVRPGHIFPLIAKDGGVLEREGHTEAAVDLAKMAGHSPVGVICEILNEDGTCARLPQLMVVAQRFDMKIITIEDLIAYKKKQLMITNQGTIHEQSYRG